MRRLHFRGSIGQRGERGLMHAPSCLSAAPDRLLRCCAVPDAALLLQHVPTSLRLGRSDLGKPHHHIITCFPRATLFFAHPLLLSCRSLCAPTVSAGPPKTPCASSAPRLTDSGMSAPLVVGFYRSCTIRSLTVSGQSPAQSTTHRCQKTSAAPSAVPFTSASR